MWRTLMVEAARRVGERSVSAGEAAAEAAVAAVFALAVEQDAGRELDWLRLYCRVQTAGQRRYCLERALAINPRSEVALAALHSMPPAD